MWAYLNHLTSGGCEGSGYGLMTRAQAEEHHTPDGTLNIWCLCWDLNRTPEYESEA
jgi:hypothetical protein